MGFWDLMGSVLDEVTKMNDDATRTASKMDIYELCEKVNNLTLLNPLLLASCQTELEYRCKRMSRYEIEDLLDRYDKEGYETVYKTISEIYNQI